MEPYIIKQTGDQLQQILNKAIVSAEAKTTEDGKPVISFTASDGSSFNVSLPDFANRINYLLQNTYYLQEGIGCTAFDYAMSLGDVPIQSEEVTRQEGDSIILDASANRFVLERNGKFYNKFLSNGTSLQGYDVYASERHTFLNLQDTTYWYRKTDGTLTKGSSTFVIKNWLNSLQGDVDLLHDAISSGGAGGGEIDNALLVQVSEKAQTALDTATQAQSKAEEAKTSASSAYTLARTANTNALSANSTANTAKTTAEAAQSNANTVLRELEEDFLPALGMLVKGGEEVVWDSSKHLNSCVDSQNYFIHGERTNANDGLPILNANPGHTIFAQLSVLDSSLTSGTGEKTDICVTQVLRLSNRMGGDGHVFVRTGQAATKEELTATDSTKWGTWEKLMGVFEKNAVSSAESLDGYTTNGMYSGMFVFGNSPSGAVGGLNIESGSTFLMVVVNGYAVASTGLTPQITQLLYVLPSGLDGSHGVRPANVYIRTGIHSPSGYIWNEFSGFGGGGASSEELNAVKTRLTSAEGNIQTIEETIQSEQARLDDVRSAAITNVSVSGDEAGVKIITENTIEPSGGDIKIPNADARNNTAGVVTAEEIRALHELDYSAASVTDIVIEKDTEKNRITFDSLGNLGTSQSGGVELTPATEDTAGLMSADDKAEFEKLKVEFEKVKNSIGVNIYGSVRVSGVSDPQLTFRRYIADGAAVKPLDVIHPCLVEKGTGRLLHILQNLNFEKDINGNTRKIDGSEGEVYITNTEPIYHITGHVYVNGVSYDVFLRSLFPFTWQGKKAERIEPFGLSPDNCVTHQDTDGVVRMHSVYNPEWNGSYYPMNGFVGKFVYEGIGDAMTETYDENGALFDGAGGLASSSVNITSAEQCAMSMNEDTTKTVPFFNEHAYALELFLGHMLAEGGTYDAHNAALMGSGYSSNDAVTGEVHFKADNESAVNGFKYLCGDGNNTKYGSLSTTISNKYVTMMLNNYASPWKIMEQHRVIAYAIENNIPELTWFAFEGNKYKWRSVKGFAGPYDGVMTCVVFKIFSTQFTSDVNDSYGNLGGHRIDFMFVSALYRGRKMDVSPSNNISGIAYILSDGGIFDIYLEKNQKDIIKMKAYDNIPIGTDIPYEKYSKIGTIKKNLADYRTDFSDYSILLAKNDKTISGGTLHTYVCAQNYMNAQNSNEGTRTLYSLRIGSGPFYNNISPFSTNVSSIKTFDKVVSVRSCVQINH